MPMLINDHRLEETMIADRRARGVDRYDEVWEGEYVMAPIATDEHQPIQTDLAAILAPLIQWRGLGSVRAGVNVSDRRVNWTENFRCPDVAVFLKGTRAENHGTHWYAGPDFAIEIVSPDDRTRKKTGFYASVGTRELLLIDRDPWQFELLRLENSALVAAGVATEQSGGVIESQVVPLTFRLVPGTGRPGILVTATDGQSWTI